MVTVDYLTQSDYGRISTMGYCDGWNCGMTPSGEIRKDYEVKDIVAWSHIPKFQKDGEDGWIDLNERPNDLPKNGSEDNLIFTNYGVYIMCSYYNGWNRYPSSRSYKGFENVRAWRKINKFVEE